MHGGYLVARLLKLPTAIANSAPVPEEKDIAVKGFNCNGIVPHNAAYDILWHFVLWKFKAARI